MKRMIWSVALAFLVIAIACTFFLLIRNSDPPVNNSDPVEKVITHYYSRADLCAAKACYETWSAFHSVNLKDLCDLFGFMVECKRQVHEDKFYYVLATENCTFLCFIFTNANDQIENMLVTKDFPTKKQFSEAYEMYGEDFGGLYTFFTSAIVLPRYTEYILEDGYVFVSSTVNDYSESEILIYEDTDLETIFSAFDGELVLPIDRR